MSFFASDDFWRRSCEVRPVSRGFFVRFQEGVMEDGVYPHLGRKFQFTVSGGCPKDFEGSVTSGLSRASPAPCDLKRGSHAKPPSPPNPPLKPSYSQIVKTKIQARDPLLASAPRDQSHDLIRSRDPTRPRDQVRFGRATRPLTNTWKTVGTNQRSTRSQGIPQGIPHSLSPMDTGTGNTLIGLRA